MANTVRTRWGANDSRTGALHANGIDVSPRIVTLGCLVATGALLGLSTILAKLAIGAGLAPIAFLAWSALGAAILLGALAVARGQLPAFDRRTAEYAFVAALVSFAAPNALLYAAVPHVGIAFVALTLAVPPLLTYAGALGLRLERFSPVRAAGVALALTGAGWIAFLKLGENDAPAGWIAAALCIPILLSVGNLYRTVRWPEGARPATLAAPMLGAASILIFAGAALTGEALFEMPPGVRVAVGLIGAQAVCLTAQMSLFFVLQRRGGPVYVSLLGSVAAVTAVPVAVVLLGESVPQGLAIGGALIAAGVLATTLGGSTAKAGSSAPQ